MSAPLEHTFDQYGRLYEKYAPALLFYARKFVSYPVAEDIVHDVFLNIWKRDSLLFLDETITSYLFRAVQNTCLNHLKRQAVHQEYVAKSVMELKILELTDASPEAKLIDREQMDVIYKAIDQLPVKCREVFCLSYINGKTNPEIAETLQISIRTVENHLYKALQTLRKLLLTVLVLYLFS